jgi:signal transduction histidine kinase
MVPRTMWRKLLDALPHGHYLAGEDWQRRHRLMLWILGLHVPALIALGLALGYTPRTLVLATIAPPVMVMLGHLLRHHRRPASVAVTAGLVYCSAELVALTHGTIEAHFHFFVIIGFIALYQDWAPFLFNIVFTVVSHGIGSAWQRSLIFEHPAGQANPWLWSLIHGLAVLVACAGAVLVLRITEDTQREKDVLGRRLAESEKNRRRFTSDLLTNLARRNQGLLHRQLELINQLEETEQDPDALADLFALDHIATRVRRNAENLLVLAGEQPPRTWSEPVPLRDVLRAAIAETENLERVVFVVDEQSAVVGHTVTDLTHLLAELTENAVRFSPPDATVTVRSRPDRARPGGRLITIEDWGLGMPADKIEEANALLAAPPDIDMGVSQRLGFHVVARIAARHGIKVGLSVTPGSGTTALVSVPPSLFAPLYPTAAASVPPLRQAVEPEPTPHTSTDTIRTGAPRASTAPPRVVEPADWGGWWDPAVASAMPAFNPIVPTISGAGPAIGDPPRNGYASAFVDYDFGSNGHGPAATGPAPIIQGISSLTNGHGTNGHGTNGHGHERKADDREPAANPVGTATDGGSTTARDTVLEPGSSTPPYRATTSSAHAGEPHPPRRPSPTPRPLVVDAPPIPTGAVPDPRSSGPVDPVSGLRRRIPQSHLSAQLRTPPPEAAQSVLDRPSNADAAAALSRYQASRAAAQAQMGDVPPGDPTTTDGDHG